MHTLHDGGGGGHMYPVDTLIALAAGARGDWLELSDTGRQALQRAAIPAESFPDLPSVQRFARVHAAANSMAEHTMAELRKDLEFYAENLKQCANRMADVDGDASVVIEALGAIGAYSDNGLAIDRGSVTAAQSASDAAGSDVAAARAEWSAAPAEGELSLAEQEASTAPAASTSVPTESQSGEMALGPGGTTAAGQA